MTVEERRRSRQRPCRAHRGFSREPRRCDPRARLGFRAEHLCICEPSGAHVSPRIVHSLSFIFVFVLLTVGDGVLTCPHVFVRGMYRYPYVSHLVRNAGVAPFLNISWSLFPQQAWRNLLELSQFKVVSNPGFYSQRMGMMNDDGLGWVWQCNMFGHYILVRPTVF